MNILTCGGTTLLHSFFLFLPATVINLRRTYVARVTVLGLCVMPYFWDTVHLYVYFHISLASQTLTRKERVWWTAYSRGCTQKWVVMECDGIYTPVVMLPNPPSCLHDKDTWVYICTSTSLSRSMTTQFSVHASSPDPLFSLEGLASETMFKWSYRRLQHNTDQTF